MPSNPSLQPHRAAVAFYWPADRVRILLVLIPVVAQYSFGARDVLGASAGTRCCYLAAPSPNWILPGHHNRRGIDTLLLHQRE
jgi:hypothetical protein